MMATVSVGAHHSRQLMTQCSATTGVGAVNRVVWWYFNRWTMMRLALARLPVRPVVAVRAFSAVPVDVPEPRFLEMVRLTS